MSVYPCAEGLVGDQISDLGQVIQACTACGHSYGCHVLLQIAPDGSQSMIEGPCGVCQALTAIPITKDGQPQEPTEPPAEEPVETEPDPAEPEPETSSEEPTSGSESEPVYPFTAPDGSTVYAPGVFRTADEQSVAIDGVWYSRVDTEAAPEGSEV